MVKILIKKIIAYILLGFIPFIVVILLEGFLNPTGFWENLIFLVIATVVAIISFIITAIVLSVFS